MSMTRTELEELRQDRFRRLHLRPPRRRPSLRAWLTEEDAVHGRWPLAVAVAWVVVFSTAVAVEPVPARPDAPEPAWAVLLFLALVGALATTWAGLARRLRLGLVASVAAAGVALASTALCPVSGHHGSVGAWWYLQFAGFSGLAGLGLLGLRRSRAAGAGAR